MLVSVDLEYFDGLVGGTGRQSPAVVIQDCIMDHVIVTGARYYLRHVGRCVVRLGELKVFVICVRFGWRIEVAKCVSGLARLFALGKERPREDGERRRHGTKAADLERPRAGGIWHM